MKTCLKLRLHSESKNGYFILPLQEIKVTNGHEQVSLSLTLRGNAEHGLRPLFFLTDHSRLADHARPGKAWGRIILLYWSFHCSSHLVLLGGSITYLAKGNGNKYHGSPNYTWPCERRGRVWNMLPIYLIWMEGEPSCDTHEWKHYLPLYFVHGR